MSLRPCRGDWENSAPEATSKSCHAKQNCARNRSSKEGRSGYSNPSCNLFVPLRRSHSSIRCYSQCEMRSKNAKYPPQIQKKLEKARRRSSLKLEASLNRDTFAPAGAHHR